MDLTHKLNELGYRMTPQRMMILSAVEKADNHISAEEIYAQVRARYPHVNVSTVYRTLDLLKELGLVTETDMGDGRVRYHSIGKGHHHHLVCEQCGETIDIEETILIPLWTEIQRKHDFKVNMKHLAFFGLCSRCRK
jgi:Fur family ferric uptake transcriptional regulator